MNLEEEEGTIECFYDKAWWWVFDKWNNDDDGGKWCIKAGGTPAAQVLDKLLQFKGLTPLEPYFTQFNLAAYYREWSPSETAVHLAGALLSRSSLTTPLGNSGACAYLVCHHCGLQHHRLPLAKHHCLYNTGLPTCGSGATCGSFILRLRLHMAQENKLSI